MQIFGHRFIKNEYFYHISNIEAIQNTPPTSTIYMPYSEDILDIINHANENEVAFALSVEDVTQLIYASSLNASYIIVSKELSKIAQDIANNYLFDAKILVSIDKESEIEELAVSGVDGVIFSNAIVKINS